jgi:hypothetical protein
VSCMDGHSVDGLRRELAFPKHSTWTNAITDARVPAQ